MVWRYPPGSSAVALARPFEPTHNDRALLVAQLLQLGDNIPVARGRFLGIAAKLILNSLDLLNAISTLSDFDLELLDKQTALSLIRLLRLLDILNLVIDALY